MRNDDIVLDVQNLRVGYRVYGGYLDVIPSLDMRVAFGERIGLVGEAGCGKTTTLRTVARALATPPAVIRKDRLLVGGKPIDGREGLRNVRRSVSMVFQDPSTSLNPTLKIRTQMTDILRSQFPRYDRKRREDAMMDSLKSVSMPAPERVLDSYAVQLSGGMRQRICIAMALMKETKLILADEPTTALDVTIEEQILELIDELVSGQHKTMILVSHALGAVRKMTDQLYVMYAGTIVERGRTKDIFSSPKHPYTIGLMEATPKLTGEGISDGIAGDIPSYFNPPKGCRFSARCPRRQSICDEAVPALTDKGGGAFVACHLVPGSEGEKR